MKHVQRALVTGLGVLLGLFLAVGVVDGQEKAEKKSAKKTEGKMEMPKPSAEVKKLGYFVGTWKNEGEMKQNPFGVPSGHFTSTDKCEWFTGGWHVVCHSSGKGPSGAMHGLGILAYNSNEKAYTYYGIDNMGFAEESKGTADGNNWAYTADEKIGGKTYHRRYSVDASSPDSYTYKYETSEDGKTWTSVMEGKATKGGGGGK